MAEPAKNTRSAGGKFAKGKSGNPNGRTPGKPNKTTAALKEAILNAFHKVGGEAYLQKVADEDPKTFCTLLGKVLPAEIKAEHTGDLQLNITLKRYGDADLDKR